MPTGFNGYGKAHDPSFDSRKILGVTAGLTDTKHVTSPNRTNLKRWTIGGVPLSDPTRYRQVVGSSLLLLFFER